MNHVTWDDAATDGLAKRIGTDAAARVARSAQRIAGKRFTVTAEGTRVLSNDEASLVTEFGDGDSASDPWAVRAIREVGHTRNQRSP